MNNAKRRLVAALSALATVPSASRAQQSQAWRTVHQPASWHSITVDHAVSPRMALWFDGQWRRMGVGGRPQQLLLRPGLQLALAPGVRVASGYAYIATAPYGEAPSPTPLREHRTWQQLVLSHGAGALSVSHRYRWEQRWISAKLTDDEARESRGPWLYQQRARYLSRIQGNLPRLRVGSRPWLALISDEILLPIGHSEAHARFAQNRASIGVGVPVSARARLELSYLNLWNALPSARTNEINHTVNFGWVWRSAPPSG